MFITLPVQTCHRIFCKLFLVEIKSLLSLWRPSEGTPDSTEVEEDDRECTIGSLHVPEVDAGKLKCGKQLVS